jgi:hypothetical protein
LIDAYAECRFRLFSPDEVDDYDGRRHAPLSVVLRFFAAAMISFAARRHSLRRHASCLLLSLLADFRLLLMPLSPITFY